MKKLSNTYLHILILLMAARQELRLLACGETRGETENFSLRVSQGGKKYVFVRCVNLAAHQKGACILRTARVQNKIEVAHNGSERGHNDKPGLNIIHPGGLPT